MKLIGITGGVGMGKSMAQSILSARSIPVIDTDEVARALVEPGEPALTEIRSQFGPAAIAADGTLKRDVLAARVFSDPAARKQLENILHPLIRAHWVQEVEKWRRAGVVVGAVVIPLLFETQAESAFDTVVCIACSDGAQKERLTERGWSEQDIRQRLAAQWPIARKISASDHVIWTDGEVRSHEQQWDRILAQLHPEFQEPGRKTS